MKSGGGAVGSITFGRFVISRVVSKIFFCSRLSGNELSRMLICLRYTGAPVKGYKGSNSKKYDPRKVHFRVRLYVP